jgi:Protein phosphatase 1 regulatory subunit 35 C-terminus
LIAIKTDQFYFQYLEQVSNMAVNVPSSDCLYNDLVSVEFAENRLKSRSTTARPVKTREKSDNVPLLSNFFSTRKEQERLWPKFPSIIMSFKPIELYNPKSVISARRNILEQTENLFKN